jgi:hypothetical protein
VHTQVIASGMWHRKCLFPPTKRRMELGTRVSRSETGHLLKKFSLIFYYGHTFCPISWQIDKKAQFLSFGSGVRANHTSSDSLKPSPMILSCPQSPQKAHSVRNKLFISSSCICSLGSLNIQVKFSVEA